MITLSLIKELEFISQAYNEPIFVNLAIGSPNSTISLGIKIDKGVLVIELGGKLIWRESLDETVGNFGIESCQQIMGIISLKHSGEPFDHLIYIDNSWLAAKNSVSLDTWCAKKP